MERSVTGIKPTGTPHLGNYFGMIKPALALAGETDAAFFVADYHALTTVRDPDELHRRTSEVAATLLALGLDTERTQLYRQSDVPEVCELAWLFSCVTAKGLMNRAHAYKAAVQDNLALDKDGDAGVTMALFEYPVLMAADILIHRADVVPVGADNRQHLEMARDIAQTFNAAYGELFTIPNAIVNGRTMLIPGIDGRKMSKSYGNVVPILASPESLRKLVGRIVTDSRSPAQPKDPETCNVFGIYRHVADEETAATMAERYRAGGVGYGEIKGELSDMLEEVFRDARARYDELMSDPTAVTDVLQSAADAVRDQVRPVLTEVRAAVGIRG